MQTINKNSNAVVAGASLIAISAALLTPTTAYAQAAAQTAQTVAEQVGAGESGDEREIVVSGSRIERAGFNQPTPTTVIGDTEIRQAARANLQQVLNDLPQVRPTVTTTSSVGNTGSGTAPVDLRGLTTARTLTLINGRRFVGENNLNLVPLNLVERLELVTGGASAAWGSGAVAGVVNIILRKDLEGISLGAEAGVSERGDGHRHRFDAAAGTSFANGNGRVMVGVEYVDDTGLPPASRLDRPGTRSPGFVPIGVVGGVVQLRQVDDVNIGTRSEGGLIRSGIFAGQTFNSDGTLRPYRGPNAQGVGGEDASNLYDDIFLATPFQRLNGFGRISYDIGNATIWADATYGKVRSDYDFFPEFTAPGDFAGGVVTVQATNPFLPQAIRTQLAAAGQSSFGLTRVYKDIFNLRYESSRENMEGAIGITGTLGGGWKYSAHFSHGEIDTRQELQNSRVAANFNNALNAVQSGGQIVCAINADAISSNDDPACRPINIFGRGNASPEAIAYVTATQAARSVAKLDSFGSEIQGDLFSLWAGPVTVAFGAEARWEEITGSRPPSTVAGGFGLPVFVSDLSGGFSVKEGFGEVVLPVLNAEALKVDLNGAARYSDYSTSGGIWSWKVGGTARLFGDVLLRGALSRDIRSPSVGDLFNLRLITVGAQVDLDTAGRNHPLYNPTPATVTTFSGGNPDLQPEIGRTFTVGGSFSPSFASGLHLAVDYYDIEISDAISTLTASNLTLACSLGNQAACDRVERDPITGTLVTAFSNAQNIASFETSGFDFEAAYVLPLSRLANNLNGSMRFRALATYVEKFISNNGLAVTDTVNQVGDAGGLPHWRGVFSTTYQSDTIGLDARVRYVGGGKFSLALNGTAGQPFLVNNDRDGRTYVDIGAQIKVADRFAFNVNVANLFDVDPPLATAQQHYDQIGRYFTAGVRVSF